MFSAYIIEEIRRRDLEEEQLEEMIIECPEIPVSDDSTEDETSTARGIVILDFTI